VEHVVEHVLLTARERLNEQLTLDDLAKIAMFSKFHFARMFRRVTGVPPRRFLYALRMQEAKRLLVTTSLSVTAISFRVGYHSVGTFTSRFTASVGVSPTVYRRSRGDVSLVLRGEPPDPCAQGLIAGRIEIPEAVSAEGPTLIGLFHQPVPEGRPARCDVLARPGDWSFDHVPAGRWFVLGVSSFTTTVGASPLLPERTMMSMSGPVTVSPETPTAHVTVRLRQLRPIDPPILVGLAGPGI
jgi:AraC-like DNA-binding protein